jgi:branched-chain amino acid transport system substrate-binding protein
MNYRQNRIHKIAYAGAAAVLCIAVAGCKNEGGAGGNTATGSASGEIVLGHYASMTGSEATFGKSSQNGVMMAVDEANAKGGVLGKQVRVQLEDDGGKPDQAITAVQKLISSDNVLAVLGEVASSNSLAAAPICQNAKVPMVSHLSTNPKVTQVGDYIFRTCFIDPFQGTVCARFAKNELKAKTAGVLTDLKKRLQPGAREVFQRRIHQRRRHVQGSLVLQRRQRFPRPAHQPARLQTGRHLYSGLLHRRWKHRDSGALARFEAAASGRRRLGFCQAG